MRYLRTYTIDFTEQQWEELLAMSFEPFEFDRGEPLTRGQWVSLRHMALGKAACIEAGEYNFEPEHPDDVRQDTARWAAELREIAAIIGKKFHPADGLV